MSKITSIFDQLKTVISTELPTYKQIPNPYELEAASNVMLAKGYGLAFGAGSNTERQLSCQLSIEREFGVLLTRQMSYTEHDAANRNSLEKTIFEDQYKLIKAIEKNSSLAQLVAKVAYASDSGIEFLGLESGRYLTLFSAFTCEYFENLT
jgi:hypothetical protein